MGTRHQETDWLSYLCNCASPYRRSTHTFQSKLDKQWYWSYHLLPEVKMEMGFFQKNRKVINHWLLHGEWQRPEPPKISAEEQEEIDAIVEESLKQALILNIQRKVRKRWHGGV